MAYDGTDFHGFQFQPNARTVQSALENALKRRFVCHTRAVGASRTDTGVHARGQAIHFDLPIGNVPDDLRKAEFALNKLLPPDVRIRSLEVAPVDEDGRPWHAIFDSRGKIYSYRVSMANSWCPMDRHYCHFEWRASQTGYCEKRMREAAERLVGKKDFTAFANRLPGGAHVHVNTIREVRRVNVEHEGNQLWRFEFELDGAMYRMVRNMTGAILDVALGSHQPSWIDSVFESKDRQQLGKSAPARGLCLDTVFYDQWPDI